MDQNTDAPAKQVYCRLLSGAISQSLCESK